MPTAPKQNDDSADGECYLAGIEESEPNTLFGLPVIHSSKVPCVVEVTFKHGFLIVEDDA